MNFRRFSNAFNIGRKDKYTISSELPMMKLEAECVIKHGYLVKSPPLEKIKSKVARWHMRWFVLHDNKVRSDTDPSIEREVEIYYYQNHESQINGDLPLGKIDLLGANVFQYHCKLHGYPHVIAIQTRNRTYYLCAQQKIVQQVWLKKIKEHNVPPLVNTRQISAYPPYAGWDQLYSPELPLKAKAKAKRKNPSEVGDKTTDSEDTKHSLTAPTTPLHRKTDAFWGATQFLTPPPVPRKSSVSVSRIREEENSEEEETDPLSLSQPAWNFTNEMTHMKRLKAKPTLSTIPLNPDSDTEDSIVRTSSDSSSTSTSSQVTVQRTFRYTSEYNAWDLGGVFNGPKLTPTKKNPLSLQKSISLMDIREVGNDYNNNKLFVSLTREEARLTLQRRAQEKKSHRFSTPSNYLSFQANI